MGSEMCIRDRACTLLWENKFIHIIRAYVCRVHDFFEEALTSMVQAYNLGAHSNGSLLLLAWLYMQHGNSIRSVELCDIVLRRNPDFIYAHNSKIFFLTEQRNWARAKKYAKNNISNLLYDAATYMLLGDIYCYFCKKVKALEYYNKAYNYSYGLELNGEMIHQKLGLIHTELDNREQAVYHFKKAMSFGNSPLPILSLIHI